LGHPPETEKTSREKSWIIEGIGPEERNAAIAAADRAGQRIEAWLTRAIRALVQAERQAIRGTQGIGPSTLARMLVKKGLQSL
jgi:hypothetical protein